MKTGAERDLTRIGWLDYVLMSIGSCLAVHSAGMSIQQPSISYFCMALVILGTCVSYSVRVLSFKSAFIKLDAFFYGGAVLCAFVFSADLRALMPEDGFPREIIAAGWLSWMLILGSFATWQDSTLLFQAIPALALFGLIGCYDTYRAVTFEFFAFVICLATLFARAHGREMLRKSADSGYFTRGLAPGTPIPSVETTPGLALKLKQGPWRWVAGPEWALLSALGVVLISLLGAPVIRRSVSGVAGFVHITPPTVRTRNAPPTPASTDVSGQNVQIGRPYSHTISRPLLEARLDHMRYLRAETYNLYTGHGWQNTAISTSGDDPPSIGIEALMQGQIRNKAHFSFELTMLRGMRLLPVPPEVDSLTVDGGSAAPRPDGTYELSTSVIEGSMIKGTGVEAAPGATPSAKFVPPQLSPYLDTQNIPARVRSLALTTVAGQKTDFEKARAIQTLISSRVLYNLDAAETPPDRDPVDFTLFDHREGYCTVFASAMVLMARSAGIPARYVQGYLPDTRRMEKSGGYIISDADYHAWAELSFEGQGWVVFDPTIGADSIAGEGLGDTGDSRPWYKKGPSVALATILASIVAVVFGLLVLRKGKTLSLGSHAKSEVDRLFVSFNRVLERFVGRRRKIGQTASEFLDSVLPHLGTCSAAAESLNDRFVRAMYAQDAISPEAVATLRTDLKAFKRALKSIPPVPHEGLN